MIAPTSSPRYIPKLQTLALNAFNKTIVSNAPGFDTFCGAFAKINQGTDEHTAALEVLKHFHWEK